MAPTRELAGQIQKVCVALSDYMKLQIHACVGGTAVRDDIAQLKAGVHVVVGTPGRVYDMINRGALKLAACKLFCLDEADEMLSRGFKDQIYGTYFFLNKKSSHDSLDFFSKKKQTSSSSFRKKFRSRFSPPRT